MTVLPQPDFEGTRRRVEEDSRYHDLIAPRDSSPEPTHPRCKNPDNVVSDGADGFYCEPCDHWWAPEEEER